MLYEVITLWGDMGRETLLTSARVLPEKLIKSGYRFVHPRLEMAMGHVLGKFAVKNNDGTI